MTLHPPHKENDAIDILITIDDTDNLDSIGTGHLANQLSMDIAENNWGTCSRITRHQLYVHEDIPYTSHNSAMCFPARIHPNAFDAVAEYAAGFLTRNSAPGSDPGLCMVKLNNTLNRDMLIAFGQSAKKEVLTKDAAYQTATKLGVRLSEHGGTGDGVVGALAGSGLRLSGNDGKFRGWFTIEAPDNIATVKSICAHEWIEAVQSIRGEIPGENDAVLLAPEIKTVLLNNLSVILVEKATPSSGKSIWQMVTKDFLKKNCY
jgi:hypothetical protein